jgi:hypothetical protein
MTDNINEMSSDQLAQLIKIAPIPQVEETEPQEFDSPGSYQADEEEEMQPEEQLSSQEISEAISEFKTNHEEDGETQELAEEKQRESIQYLEGRIKGAGGEEQFMNDFQSALASDYRSLRDRYSVVGDLVDRFADHLIRGKIKIKDEDMKNSDNPHEHTFLTWIGKPAQMRDLSVEEIEEVITIGAQGSPLRSKVKEFARPSEMHPIPRVERPKPKRREPTYKMPDITGEDFKEMLTDWSRKHPEKFR